MEEGADAGGLKQIESRLPAAFWKAMLGQPSAILTFGGSVDRPKSPLTGDTETKTPGDFSPSARPGSSPPVLYKAGSHFFTFKYATISAFLTNP